MEVIVIAQQEDAAHLVALLTNFTRWGMIRYYDMDAVFQNIEQLSFRYFLIHIDDLLLMDWRAFADFLEQMHCHAKDPMRSLYSTSFLVVDQHGTRLYDFNRFSHTVRSVGHP